MKISVVGAYGYTGKLICDELNSFGFLYSIVGRNKLKLDELRKNLKIVSNSWYLDLQNEEDCDFLIANSDIIINCAGPFTEESIILLKKIAHSGKIYLDISGELGFIKNSRENYHQKAIENKSLIIHGCAFESLITDLFLQKNYLKSENLKSIRTFYLFDNSKASPGTRITMKLAKFRINLKIFEKKWTESNLEKDKFEVQFSDESDILRAIVYPLPEIAFSYWSYQPETVESYLLMKPEEAMFVFPRKADSNSILDTLNHLKVRKIKGPTIDERRIQKSKIIIQIIQKDGLEKVFLLESKDMYQTTAKAIVLTVNQLFKQPMQYFGVLNPAKLFLHIESEVLTQLSVSNSNEKVISIQKV
jgi:short subunit dehydrogenase-like uncharacterized protein